eukprot:3021643-Lingulodinium_polyedra.AAC.1
MLHFREPGHATNVVVRGLAVSPDDIDQSLQADSLGSQEGLAGRAHCRPSAVGAFPEPEDSQDCT